MANKLAEFKPTIFSGSKLNGGDIRLSLSENPYRCSPKAFEALYSEIANVHCYPDADYLELRTEIANRYRLDPEAVFLGNGTDELIFLTALLANRERPNVVTTEKTFGGYKYSAILANRSLVECPIDERTVRSLCESVDEHTAMVFLCNPHNPSGTFIPPGDLWPLAEACERYGALLVLDEAYIEYTEKEQASAEIVKRHDNALILRTFSKAYGLAGLRCGYALSNNRNLKAIQSSRNALPYNLNRLASAAALAAFRDREHLKHVVRRNDEIKQWFCTALEELGIPYIPSSANFVTIRMENSADFVERMYRQFKIAIRDLSGFGYRNHIRISFGTREQMNRVAEAFKMLTMGERV
ncbi:histidinol-phosphate transaminase [Cohnella algarum]|uniref:histidinol-phosphate transaminase n=1 Tax=Cohnella algarum TaxID=2044859 RepID=UPI001967616F|nr:histidinol-phosphate transaminase [Cohnella algarum]MBN2983978.1 histidinol-phosphate transaminase [Cohnella algarum]